MGTLALGSLAYSKTEECLRWAIVCQAFNPEFKASLMYNIEFQDSQEPKSWQSWKNGSVTKVLAMTPWEPEFSPQAPHKNARGGDASFSPITRRVETGGSLGLTKQSS